MNHRRIFFVSIIALAITCCGTARAGVTLTEKVADKDTGKSTSVTMYVDGNRLAYGTGRGGMIFDGDKQTSKTYDLERKVYMELTATHAQALKKRAEAAQAKTRKMLRERLKHLPKSQRKLMKREWEKQNEGPHFKRLGGSKTVGKWACTPVVKVDPNGNEIEHMCIATYKALGIGRRDREALESIKRFNASMSSASEGNDSGFGLKAEKEVGLKGIPIRDDDDTSTSTLVSVRHGAVPEKVFHLPKGMKKMTLPMMP